MSQVMDPLTPRRLQQAPVASLGGTSPARIFALIIGIDKYPPASGLVQLKSAVSDAQSIEQYLLRELKVPPSHITTIYDETATREGILNALQSFHKNKWIAPGDPIFIYFAGHGGQGAAPPGWSSEGDKIQLLLPYDTTGAQSSGETIGHGIPDRTIGAILNSLVQVLGDNITVAFDCCYATSITRTAKDESRDSEDDDTWFQYRGAEVEFDIPVDLDREFWEGVEESLPVDIMSEDDRGLSTPQASRRTELYSHILLAACKSDQRAREMRAGGAFTQALLKTLRNAHANLDKTTYTDLIRAFPSLTGQDPQCEGYNRNRILFNAKVQLNTALYNVIQTPDRRFELSGGEPHGILEGSTFALYANPTAARSGNEPLDVVRAGKPTALTTPITIRPKVLEALRFDFDTPVVRQVFVGAEDPFPIYVPKEADLSLRTTLEGIRADLERYGKRTFKVVHDRQKATMGVELSQDQVQFPILGSLTSNFGMLSIPHSVPLTKAPKLGRILEAAARFDWYLHRESHEINEKHVDVELTELTMRPEIDKTLGCIVRRYIPNGQNLIEDGNIVHFNVGKPMRRYGMKVVNKTGTPLWVTMLYFDHSNLSIGTMFEPPAAPANATSEAPLKPKSSLTVGYGAGGVRPQTFVMEHETQEVEVGTIKLYFSTAPTDLQPILQSSPFEDRPEDDEDNRGGGTVSLPVGQPVWGTIAIRAILKKA